MERDGVSKRVLSQEEQLQDAIAQLTDNPLGFVYFAFDWGKGALEGEDGPDQWQIDILRAIGDRTLTATEAIQIAVRSGHGIGKTCLISWILLWFLSTRPFPQVVVTANTTAQLSGKTWRELAKWHKLAINKHWFKWTATKFYHVDHPEDWFAAATPWSKERSEAFAGTHEKYVLVVFDEASWIPDVIWETAEGAMTTEGAMWVVFGNPTRNTGRFSQCFKRFRHRWFTMEVDSRTAKKANKKQIEQWIEDYGEDSDFVRVRVKGQEPRAGSMQLIGNDIVEPALGRSIHEKDYYRMPKIMGVDVARQGDDSSVICKRQGLACHNLIKLHLDDNMVLAARVAQEINDWKPDKVFIDQGAGVGVIDRLRQLGFDVVEVPFGSTADDGKHYANKRAEMWCRMRDWIKGGACLPDDKELRDDLIGPEYGFQGIGDRIILERKEDMRSRGLASPDCADALALTFAYPVAVEGDYEFRRMRHVARLPEYDPYAVLQ